MSQLKIDCPCDISDYLLNTKKLVGKLINLTACPTNINLLMADEIAEALLLEAQAIKLIIEKKQSAKTNQEIFS